MMNSEVDERWIAKLHSVPTGRELAVRSSFKKNQVCINAVCQAMALCCLHDGQPPHHSAASMMSCCTFLTRAMMDMSMCLSPAGQPCTLTAAA